MMYNSKINRPWAKNKKFKKPEAFTVNQSTVKHGRKMM